MKKQTLQPPPKPLAIETRVVLSMVYQVKDRLEIKKWMTHQDIFEAHSWLFKRIEIACYDDYRLAVSVQHHVKAIELLLIGFNPDDILD